MKKALPQIFAAAAERGRSICFFLSYDDTGCDRGGDDGNADNTGDDIRLERGDLLHDKLHLVGIGGGIDRKLGIFVSRPQPGCGRIQIDPEGALSIKVGYIAPARAVGTGVYIAEI